MAVKKITFDKTGGAVKVDIQYNGLVAASYTYTLWEANSNVVVDQKPGNNQNTQDDNYTLPDPALSNIGRMIDIHSTIQGLYNQENEGAYTVIITVTQDGKELDKEVQPAPPKVIGNRIVVHQYFAIMQ